MKKILLFAAAFSVAILPLGIRAQTPVIGPVTNQPLTYTPQTAGGTGGGAAESCTANTGTCNPYRGVLTYTAGTGATGNGVILKVSWPNPLPNVPVCQFGGWAGSTTNGNFYNGTGAALATTTSFSVYYNATLAATNNITFTWNCTSQGS